MTVAVGVGGGWQGCGGVVSRIAASRRRAWRGGGAAAAVWQGHSGEQHRALSRRRDMAKPRRPHNFITSSTREITKLDIFVLYFQTYITNFHYDCLILI